mgnify:CR=1 FL=1
MKKILFLLLPTFLPLAAFGQSVEYGGQATSLGGLTITSLTVTGQTTFLSSTSHVGSPSIYASSTVIVAASSGIQIGNFIFLSEAASTLDTAFRIDSSSNRAHGIQLGWPLRSNVVTYAMVRPEDTANIHIVPHGAVNVQMFSRQTLAANRELRIFGDLSGAGRDGPASARSAAPPSCSGG